ncbi:hypothetical protein [Vibrio rumoiensis]|uniref:Lipoprotein n=1 Tax=Vibrio rumoiensis 1S-45 TaxID=1188252 RepID=A0A1E5E0G5_9VIBR|nr:hypothetical protein [Vibrio rumoiensis]OEF23909.1 hypothetical protein A1QC_01810 [Vibrio rumoiensis 1S-45]
MKYLGLAGLLVITLAGCSSPTQEDNYLDASFQLCNTDVKIFSTSDDGKVRIVCADGSKFAMDNAKTLDTMQDLNASYCSGGGLGQFNESSRYYMFKCKSGSMISINKKD